MLGAALSLCACATATPAEIVAADTAPPGPQAARVAPDKDSSPYGLFLAGNAALNDGRSAVASQFLSQLTLADDDA
ncbi:hypothetical protein BH11PSE2_BH11PSE2_07410 [soil metagenome]